MVRNLHNVKNVVEDMYNVKNKLEGGSFSFSSWVSIYIVDSVSANVLPNFHQFGPVVAETLSGGNEKLFVWG